MKASAACITLDNGRILSNLSAWAFLIELHPTPDSLYLEAVRSQSHLNFFLEVRPSLNNLIDIQCL